MHKDYSFWEAPRTMWGVGKLQLLPSALPRSFCEHAIQCILQKIWLGWAWCTTRQQLASPIIHPEDNMGLHSCWRFACLMEHRILESSASEKSLEVTVDSLPRSQPKPHASSLGHSRECWQIPPVLHIVVGRCLWTPRLHSLQQGCSVISA